MKFWLYTMSIFMSSLGTVYAAPGGGDSSKFYYNGLEYNLSYFLASQISGLNVDTVEFKISTSVVSKYYVPAVGLRYNYIRNDGFGFNVGGRVDFMRSLNRFEMVGGGVSVSGAPKKDITMTLLVPELNITSSVDRAYWFFGVNHLTADMTGFDPLNIQGDVGGQLGIGWDWGSNIKNIDFGTGRLNFELVGQILNLRLQTSSGTTSQGSYSGVMLRWGVTY